MDDSDSINNLLVAFYSNRSLSTCKSYRNDLEAFRRHLGELTIHDVIHQLIHTPHSQANLTVLHYKVKLLEQAVNPSTINRRLSSIRSLLKTAQKMNLIHWQLDIKNEKIKPYDKTRINGKHDFKKLLEIASTQNNQKKAARDCAILRLLHDLALKRSSITRINFSDLNTHTKKISVYLPGTSKKTIKSISNVTYQVLINWIKYRGEFEGPLFINFDHANKGKRLTGTSIYRTIRKFSEKCGLSAGPEEIRNGAISEVITKAEAMGIDLSEIKAFSDHKNIKNLIDFNKKKEETQKFLSDLVTKE